MWWLNNMLFKNKIQENERLIVYLINEGFYFVGSIVYTLNILR